MDIKTLVNKGKKPARKSKKIADTLPNHLKQMVKIECCKRKKRSSEKRRGKFGTCRCDSYSLSHSFGNIFANALFQYLHDARRAIIRQDWDIIEKHAKAIREWASADSWDEFMTNKIAKDGRKRRMEFLRKKRNWVQAMKWLTREWHGLWW